MRRNVDLRSNYYLYIQIGFILTFLLLIGLVNLGFETGNSFQVQMQEQETVDMRQIQQTQQEKTPPPPPRPPVPIEVPNNKTIDQEDVDFDASLDMDQSLNVQGPPPSSEESEEEEKEIFVVVEKDPDCGGLSAVQEEVEYPKFAREAGIEGTVYTQFVVNEKGNILNAKVVRGVHKMLDEAALEAVNRLDCTPGEQRGEKVKVQMSLPIVFELQ